MLIREAAKSLDSPALMDYIANEIRKLLKCDLSVYEMEFILDWTEPGDGDWNIVVEYVAAQVFKRKLHMDDLYELFQNYEGFYTDVKKTVSVKKQEHEDHQIKPVSDVDVTKTMWWKLEQGQGTMGKT